MINNLYLANDRLYLKSLEPMMHSKKITEWLNDPYINKYLVARYKLNTEADQISQIESLNSSSMPYYFGIFLGTSSQLIGTTTCRIKEESALEIGILIGNKVLYGRGSGVSTLTLLEIFARTLMLKKLSAEIECENQASIALFLKMGFEFEKEAKMNEYATKCFQVSKDLIYDKIILSSNKG